MHVIVTACICRVALPCILAHWVHLLTTVHDRDNTDLHKETKD